MTDNETIELVKEEYEKQLASQKEEYEKKLEAQKEEYEKKLEAQKQEHKKDIRDLFAGRRPVEERPQEESEEERIIKNLRAKHGIKIGE